MTHDIKCPLVAPSLAFDNERVCQCELIKVVRADQQPADVNQWLAIGIGHGWVSKPACSVHDRIPTTQQEEDAWDAGHDPCAPVVRIWADGLPT